jgi:hypothetical protein
MLCLGGANIISTSLFRFDKEWLKDEEFNRLIHKWWLEISLSGDIGRSWRKKVKNT